MSCGLSLFHQQFSWLMCRLTYNFNYCIREYFRVDSSTTASTDESLLEFPREEGKFTSIVNNFPCLWCQNTVFPQELVDYVVVNPLFCLSTKLFYTQHKKTSSSCANASASWIKRNQEESRGVKTGRDTKNKTEDTSDNQNSLCFVGRDVFLVEIL